MASRIFCSAIFARKSMHATFSQNRRGVETGYALSLRAVTMIYFSCDNTSVPAADSMPPMPFTSDSLTLGTWRAPHSPRCWRVASMIGKTPYMPECVYDRPPPLVLIGNEPPAVDLPSAKQYAPSPGLAKPSDSSMMGGPDVKAS